MKLVIDGIPVSQGRMRSCFVGGFSRIYDPCSKEKKVIKEIISLQFTGKFFEHPRVSFIFHMPIPKGIPKRMHAIYHSGLLRHEKKPDVDNFIKLYLDCMQGICFEGDQKASLGPCIKLYHTYPKTIIILNETQEILSPVEVDPLTWHALFGAESGKCSSYEMAALADSYTPDRLDYQQSVDMIYPQQTISASMPMPLVRAILEQAHPT